MKKDDANHDGDRASDQGGRDFQGLGVPDPGSSQKAIGKIQYRSQENHSTGRSDAKGAKHPIPVPAARRLDQTRVQISLKGSRGTEESTPDHAIAGQFFCPDGHALKNVAGHDLKEDDDNEHWGQASKKYEISMIFVNFGS